MLTVNALAATDRVLVPIRAEYLSAKGLEQRQREKGQTAHGTITEETSPDSSPNPMVGIAGLLACVGGVAVLPAVMCACSV